MNDKPGQRTTRDSGFDADRAIETFDEDVLELGDFVARLARPLVEDAPESSLVVGLYGPWGQGKSSLLNLLALHLRATRLAEGGAAARTKEAVVIRFAPWLYRDVDQLLAAFFDTLRKEVAGEIPANLFTRARMVAALDKLQRSTHGAVTSLSAGAGGTIGGGILGGAVATLIHASPAITGVGVVFGAAAGVASSVLRVQPAAERHFQIQKQKAERVIASLARHGRPLRVVVLIDDLDRADAPEIVATLKLVKLVADLPNVTYLIAMDDQRVRDVLARSPVGAYGQDFLEKIIQVVVHVPPIDPSALQRLIIADAARIVWRAGLDPSPLGDDQYWKLVRDATRTLRSRSRLLNGLRFMLSTAGPNPDLHAGDAFLIAFLQTHFPAAYDGIRAEKRWLLELPDPVLPWSVGKGDQDIRQEREQRLNKLVVQWTASDAIPQGAAISARHAVEAALVDAIVWKLFPSEATAEDDAGRARHEGRIRAPECFDWYFRLAPPREGEVSRSEVESTLEILLGEGALDPAGALAGLLSSWPEAKKDSLSRKLADAIAAKPVSLAQTIAPVLPTIGPCLGTDNLLWIASATLRSLATFRAAVDGADKQMELATALVLALIESLPLQSALNVAIAFASQTSRIFIFPADVGRRIASAGIARIRLHAAATPDFFTSMDYDDAVRLVWSWQRLLASSGTPPPHELTAYIGGLLASRPTALSEIIGLAATSGSTGRSLRSWMEVSESLAVLADVQMLIGLARAAIEEGSADETRFPSLVHAFVELVPPQATSGGPRKPAH